MAMKAGVPGSVRRDVMAAGRYTCAECGLLGWEQRFQRGGFGYPTANDGIYLSVDHIVPRSRGGSSDRSNVRVLCTTCNRRKGAGHAA